MRTPTSAHEAGRMAVQLLKRSVKGSPSTVASECQRAARIAHAIWHRWHIGPWQWQHKHVRWYLEHRTAELSDWTRYRYWLTVKRMLKPLRKLDHWRPTLNGPWTTAIGNQRKNL